MTTLSLPFGKTRTQRFIATVAAVAATASLAAVFQVSSAHAAIEPAQTMLLPPAFIVASADADGNSAGLGGGPRNRAREHTADQAAASKNQPPAIDKHLTGDQVRDIVAGSLAMRGNANLKAGKVTAKEDGVVTVEIVTKTGALVNTRDISTKTGRPVGFERRFGQMRHHMMAHRMMAHGAGRAGEGRAGEGRGEAHGQARRDRGPGEKPRDLALTTDQVKKLAEARLIIHGNPHVKVGAVKEKDADTITVDIVAADNSLVTQELIDRHSGRPQRAFGQRRS